MLLPLNKRNEQYFEKKCLVQHTQNIVDFCKTYHVSFTQLII